MGLIPSSENKRPTVLATTKVHRLRAIKPAGRLRFWNGFGDHYTNVFTVLAKTLAYCEQPWSTAKGLRSVPLRSSKAVLPDPSTLAAELPARPVSAILVNRHQGRQKM